MMVSGIFSGMEISKSGLVAQKRKIETIANNLANINTTRTKQGGPYKRQDVVLKASKDGRVDVVGIVESDRFRLVYDPGHPDADTDGYVRYPDINLVEEWTKMITASRVYEANIAAFNLQKQNFMRTLDLLR